MEPSSQSSFFDRRILIIDDVELISAVVTKHLLRGGFKQVRTETNSNNAMAVIENFRPDLILLDVKMPDVSGLELLASLRSIPDQSKVIVVMLSSAGLEEQQQALDLGANGFLQKPVTAEKLIGCVLGHFEAQAK